MTEKNKCIHIQNDEIEIIRATQLWQQAGAYSVRIQGMNRQHQIPLELEFDEHDGPDTKYIVLLQDGYPIGTCRLFPVSSESAEIGRVVVLEEYRNRGLGTLLIQEAQQWLIELGYRKVQIESRDVAVGFYKRLGYRTVGEPRAGETFVCVPMCREL